ncbi:MAG: hypothetical protein KDD82_03135 [Planctomycetes bacterium]|nr:hypothetical protein [Planctomycetota bacterium]
MATGQLETRCNRCAYRRSFSLDLGGRYYRCPQCKQGVLAVPRPSAEDASSWRDGQTAWIRESAQRLGVDFDEVAPPESDEVSQPDAVEELDSDEAPNNRGEAAAVRKLLVECALCDFLVQIPTEFFGKTVQCRNCAGNIVFTESTLEPIKDELLDRLLLESRERDLLERPHDEEVPPAWRSLALGLALGAGIVLLLGLVVLLVRG